MFKTDKEVNELKSIETVISETGAGATGLVGSGIMGVCCRYKGNMDFLLNSIIEKIRVYTRDGYFDLEIKKKDSDKINKLYQIFLREVNK